MEKGSYGYIKDKRTKLIMWLFLDIAVAVAIFIIGLMLNDFSNANIFTVVAMLFTLPGAKILVSLIVVFPYKGLSDEIHKQIAKKTNNSEAVLYDLVLTSPEKVMYIKSVAITNDEYIILPDNKMLKSKSKDTELDSMNAYIHKHMSNYGFEKEIVIIENEMDYVEKLGTVNFENENLEIYETENDDKVKLEKIKKTLLILEV